ncbi:MAG TPA: EAL domain-containing protein [Micromonosporaceae bacterium]|nr:EAL domain-containing protein [Micromonosporaceae bacterium]
MVVLYGREGMVAQATPGQSGASTEQLLIRDVIDRRLIRAEFQPIVRLDSGGAVAYEAYARGPADSPLSSPLAMVRAAEEAGLMVQFDQTAHAAAYQAALDARLNPSLSLFVNADPAALGAELSTDFVAVVALALTKLRILIEISEHHLAANPSGTLAGIARARACGWGISWDHLGATSDSLALMPFVQPDVVKIDVSLVHDRFHPDAARVVNAVTAYAERTGASIMATGIETKKHLATARGMGAELGQGYLFGRPGPLPANTTPPAKAVPLVARYEEPDPIATPFEIFAAQRQPASASVTMLEGLGHHLEQRCSIDPEPAVMLVSLPEAALVSGGPVARLQMIARNAAFVAALLGEVQDHPISRVRTAVMPDGDPLRDEWNLAVVGPHFAALLTARRNARSQDDNTAVSYGLTYDRPLVLAAARALLQRFSAAEEQRP